MIFCFTVPPEAVFIESRSDVSIDVVHQLAEVSLDFSAHRDLDEFQRFSPRDSALPSEYPDGSDRLHWCGHSFTQNSIENTPVARSFPRGWLKSSGDGPPIEKCKT